jgi:hypothetical protein
MELELVKEKTIKEQLEDAKRTGHGIVIPTFHVADGTMGKDDPTDTFNIVLNHLVAECRPVVQ